MIRSDRSGKKEKSEKKQIETNKKEDEGEKVKTVMKRNVKRKEEKIDK